MRMIKSGCAVGVRFSVHHVLSAADSDWPGVRGQLSDDIFDQFLPSSEVDASTLVCVCGPAPFTQQFLRSVSVARVAAKEKNLPYIQG